MERQISSLQVEGKHHWTMSTQTAVFDTRPISGGFKMDKVILGLGVFG